MTDSQENSDSNNNELNKVFYNPLISEKVDNNEPKEIRKQKALEEIKLIIEELGLWNVNYSALSRKYGFDDKTIAKWTNGIIKGIPDEQLERISVDFQSAYKSILKYNRRIIANESYHSDMRLKAAQIILDAMEKYTVFLEKWGKKNKTPELTNIQIDGNLDLTNIAKIVEDNKKKNEANTDRGMVQK